ncbi:MAG: 4Fe-4S binding protein [Candidatus Latescibacteria bacterium]|nr:4Fe-4S binding protein [Candidatus Latescibacterota bacterium]
MKRGPRPALKNGLLRYLFVIAVLSAALLYGSSRSGPDLMPHIREIFPLAASFEQSDGIYSAFSDQNDLLGWAAAGRASGFGGHMLVVVGIDTTGEVAGAKVVEHRETPLFFRVVRSSEFFGAIRGRSFEKVNYEYSDIVGVTGATRSSEAIVAGVRNAITRVSGPKFGVHMPAPERPFEFGILEVVVLLLFTVAVAAARLPDSLREVLRWASQVTGLLVIGFWKNSPITIAKITSLMSGYFPDIQSNLSLYLLIAGFMLTVLVLGRSIYCTHICPFGAAQQIINLIGGKNIKLPIWAARLMIMARNVIVFTAVVAAFITVQPALTSYEPFATLFALRGTVLQWLLLLVVMVTSLFIHRPWCNFLCPVRTCERVLQDIRRRSTGLREASDGVCE